MYHKYERNGSVVDAINLEKSMKNLGFTVKVYDNHKTKEVLIKLKKYANHEANNIVCHTRLKFTE